MDRDNGTRATPTTREEGMAHQGLCPTATHPDSTHHHEGPTTTDGQTVERTEDQEEDIGNCRKKKRIGYGRKYGVITARSMDMCSATAGYEKQATPKGEATTLSNTYDRQESESPSQTTPPRSKNFWTKYLPKDKIQWHPPQQKHRKTPWSQG